MSAYCCVKLDFLLTLNHDARNHELKKIYILFLVLSFLEIRADRRQKSISVEFSFATVIYKCKFIFFLILII